MEIGTEVVVTRYDGTKYKTKVRHISGSGEEQLVWCHGLQGAYPIHRVEVIKKDGKGFEYDHDKHMIE